MTTVAVFGASGYVGAALVDYLLADGRTEVRPVIHSSGNAWELARRGLHLRSADLASPEQIRQVVRGCDGVVNCAWPALHLMTAGLRNLMTVCMEEKVGRFVHLSSVAVYGDPPPPDSVREEAEPRPAKNSYGWYKLQQDRLVEQFHRRGLPSVVLCPPNITGPNSRYVLDLLAALRNGTLPLVDDGRWPCSLVDVYNLAAAIRLGLSCASPDGKRIFVTDGEATTWRDVVEALLPLADGAPMPPSISSEEAQRLVAGQKSADLSLVGVAKTVLGLPETRVLLKRSRLIRRIYDGVRRGIVPRLPSGMRSRLTATLEGAGHIEKTVPPSPWATRFCLQQLRKVNHGCDRARSVLGYAPPLSFARSMEVFRGWYSEVHGYGGPWWPLLRELYPHAAQGSGVRE